MLSSVYKSSKTALLYLYVEQESGLIDVPEELFASFGKPEWVLDVELHEDRQLAMENPVIVRQNIREKGYHLQWPPADRPARKG